MSGSLRDVEKIIAALDPVMQPELRRGWSWPQNPEPIILNDDGSVVLVGHRAAGKTTILPLVAAWLGWPAVDLDREISRRAGEDVRAIFARGESGFRRMERETFLAIPRRHVIAVGGGFLSHHADLLRGHVAVMVPISFETYRARLLADSTRPRLRPDLSLDEEIASIYLEREALHARVSTVPLIELLARGVH